MIKCPKCNAKQNGKKLMLLHNFNSITCPGCGAVLKANKFRSSMIGGIGGGAVAIVGLQMFKDGFSLIWFGLFVVIFFLIGWAQLTFTKLYEEKT